MTERSESNPVQALVDAIEKAVDSEKRLAGDGDGGPMLVVPWELIWEVLVEHAHKARGVEVMRIADQVAANEAHAADSTRANKAEAECRELRDQLRGYVPSGIHMGVVADLAAANARVAELEGECIGCDRVSDLRAENAKLKAEGLAHIPELLKATELENEVERLSGYYHGAGADADNLKLDLRTLLDTKEGGDPRHNTCVDCGRTKNSIGGGTRRLKGGEWHCLGGCKPAPPVPNALVRARMYLEESRSQADPDKALSQARSCMWTVLSYLDETKP